MPNEVKPDVSNILQGILSNPQALSSIMSVIGNATQKQTSVQEVVQESEPLPAIAKAPMPPPRQNEQKQSQPKEIALLMALKPFLSSRKCDTIDTFVRLFDIANLLRGVK